MYSQAERELALALWTAGEKTDRIRSLCGGISVSALYKWCREADLPARRGGSRTPDPVAIQAALDTYAAQVAAIPEVVAPVREPKRSRVYVPSGRLLVCPDGCTCLLCQLKMPVERGSTHSLYERSTIRPTRSGKPRAQ